MSSISPCQIKMRYSSALFEPLGTASQADERDCAGQTNADALGGASPFTKGLSATTAARISKPTFRSRFAHLSDIATVRQLGLVPQKVTSGLPFGRNGRHLSE